MPGFRPENKVYRLTFDGTDYSGLIIRIGCCTVGEFNTTLVGDPEKRLKENNEALFEMFLKYLVSWNLESKVPDTEDDWVPTPYTMEAIEVQESQMMSAVIGAWQRAMIGISPNLRLPSNDGETSEELELDLASLSESQQN